LLAAKVGKSALRIAPKRLNRKLRNKLYKSIGSQALDNPLLEETFKKIVGEDVQESAQKITIPTLIIYGKNDQDTPSEYGRLLQAKIKESKLYIIDDAGHYVFIDKPKEVLNLINVFLNNKENH
jgi:pimeloyl-ACP methyl ester carboxylesterase